MNHPIYNTSGIILLALSLLFLFSCSKPPAEQAIRETIAQIEQAVEDKNARSVVRHLTTDFIANDHMDRKQLRQYLAMHFLGQNNIRVIITNLDIQHTDDNPYYANMQAVAAVTGAENLIPDEGRVMNISADWMYVDGNWLISQVHWQ